MAATLSMSSGIRSRPRLAATSTATATAFRSDRGHVDLLRHDGGGLWLARRWPLHSRCPRESGLDRDWRQPRRQRRRHSDLTVVTLTCSGTTAVDFGSLADGRYTLDVLGNQVSTATGGNLDGNGDGIQI